MTFVRSDRGLEILYPNKVEREKIEINIVAVHGFNGHRRESWALLDRGTDIGATWLQYHLPEHIPNACIMTFGYDSLGNTEVCAGMSAAGILNAAQELLKALVPQIIEKKPIVFLCQGLGGTIVKEMLWIANNERAHVSMAVNTSLLVFFGTVHRPTVSSPWDDLLLDIALASTESRRDQWRQAIASMLHSGSAGVQGTSERFEEIASQFTLLNFYETKPSSLTGSVIVPKECATLETFEIRSYERHEDHLNVARFRRSEQTPRLVATHILNSIAAACPTRIYPEYLQYRQFFSTVLCNTTNLMTLNPTVQWLFKCEAFREWLRPSQEGHPSILSIYGNSGSGKSEIAFFLARNIVRQMWQQRPAIRATILQFSFDEFNYSKRSFRDLLVSYLRQLLSHGQKVYDTIRHIYSQIRDERVGPWTTEDLWIVFQSAVTSWDDSCQLIFIINSLDACDSSREQLLQYVFSLTSLKKGKPIKMVFTARCLVNMPSDQQVTLLTLNLDEPSNEVLQERFAEIRAKLQALAGAMPDEAGAEIYKRISDLLEKVSPSPLEIQVLLKRSIAQKSTRATLEGLTSDLELLGSEQDPCILRLNHLYKLHKMPNDLTGNDQGWLYRALSWILYSEEPLYVNQLAVALQVQSHPDTSVLDLHIKFGSIQSPEIEHMIVSLPRLLGGMVKVVDGKAYLVHQTVREFLFRNGTSHEHQGQTGSFLDLKDAPRRHAELTKVCILYLSRIALTAEGVQFAKHILGLHTTREAGKQDPLSHSTVCGFVMYAAQHWPAHFNKAATDEDPLLQQVETFLGCREKASWWSKIYWALQEMSTLANTGTPEPAWSKSKVEIAAHFGFASLVTKFWPETTVEERLSALKFAASNNQCTLLKVLLETMVGDQLKLDCLPALEEACRAGHELVVELLSDEKLYEQPPDLKSCFINAIKSGHSRVVGFLADERNVVVPPPDPNSTTLLHIAAMNGHNAVIALLRRLKIWDVKASNEERFVPLHLAARNGHWAAVVELLRDEESDVNAKPWAITPLHLAAGGGHLAVVQELCTRGANIDAVDPKGRTPLHWASEQGRSGIVHWLLHNTQSDVVAADKKGKTPLHKAAKNGHIAVVEILLKESADPEAKTVGLKAGWRPLHYAARKGHYQIVQKLAENGANVDAVINNITKVTPLHLAAYLDHYQAIQTLISFGAEVDKQSTGSLPNNFGCAGMTALHFSMGDCASTEILTGSKATLTIKDSMGKTPFSYAVGRPSWLVDDNALKALLGQGDSRLELMKNALLHVSREYVVRREYAVRRMFKLAPDIVDSKDKEGYTLLRWAAENDIETAIEVLLNEYEVDINSQDNHGFTPLDATLKFNASAKTIELLLNHALSLGFDDKPGRTLLFYTAASNNIEATEFLLRKGVDKEKGDNIGRRPIDVATGKEVRLLVACTGDAIESTRASNCHNLGNTQKNLMLRVSCDVCTREEGLNDQFYYHCCSCKEGNFNLCITCYHDGVRCQKPDEEGHQLRVRYISNGMISYEEYSPWVGLQKLPRDIEANS